MDLQTKTHYILHDGDSYEIVTNGSGDIREIWRYRGNQTSKPEFCRINWLDDILKDRIYDKIVRDQ
jgi:hypothetical protein